MPLDPELLSECPYLPDGIFLEEITEVNEETGRVVARMPTPPDLPLTTAQRQHATIHPRHVNGGLMVHVAGIVGFAHAFYLLGLRYSEGWTGYGVRIRQARYPALARIGPPIVITCDPVRITKRNAKIAATYRFEFHQDEELVFESEQTAMFVREGVGPTE